MNILYITPSFSTSIDYLLKGEKPSGMPGQVKFIEHLKTTQNNVLIISEIRNHQEKCRAIKNIKIYNSPGFLDNLILKSISYFSSIIARKINFFLFFLRYCYTIFKFKPDVVYGCWYFGAGVGQYYAKIFNIPLVVRMFGTGLAGKLDDLDDIVRNMRNNDSYFHIYPFLVKSHTLIITADGTRGDAVAEKLGYPIEKLIKIYNGVDFSKDKKEYDLNFIKKKYNIPKDSIVFTYTGRLAGWKRTDRLMQVFKKISQIYNEAFLLVGGFGRDEDEMIYFAQKNNFIDRIKFTGQVEHDDISNILAISDIHLSLNDLTNLTNTTIEALSMGCAVVAIDVGETSDILKHNSNSILVSEDIDDIIRNIEILIRDDHKEIYLVIELKRI